MPNALRVALVIALVAVLVWCLDWVARWVLRAREWGRIRAALDEGEAPNAAHETYRFGQTRKEPPDDKGAA